MLLTLQVLIVQVLQNMLPQPFAVPSPQSLVPAILPQLSVDPAVREMLGSLDLNRAKVSILRNFTMEAYYNLLDVWREGSHRLGDAIRAYKSHIETRERHDWRAFFVSVFGYEKMHSMLRKETSSAAPITPASTATPEPADTPEEKPAVAATV